MNAARGGGPERDRALVVGIGAPDRADDALGPAVIGLLAERRAMEALGGRDVRPPIPPGVRLLVLHDPMRLVDEMAGCELLVVVDAVADGGPEGAGDLPPPGTLLVLECGVGQPPLPALPDPRGSGTHGLGITEAVELGRALGRLPPRVVVVGVVADGFEAGAPMSVAAREAIPRAARQVLELLRCLHAGDEPDPTAPPVWLPHPTGAPEPPTG